MKKRYRKENNFKVTNSLGQKIKIIRYHNKDAYKTTNFLCLKTTINICQTFTSLLV